MNAGEWGTVPSLASAATAGDLKLGDGPTPIAREPAPQSDDEGSAGSDSFTPDDELYAQREDDPADEEESLYGAAYENVVFRDSAQDGHLGDTVDDSNPQYDTDLDLIANPLESRMRFLVTISQAWGGVAEWLAGGMRSGRFLSPTARRRPPARRPTNKSKCCDTGQTRTKPGSSAWGG